MGANSSIALGDPNVMQQRANAFDVVFDAVVVTDLAGRIVDWNVGAKDLFGWTRDEALGQRVSILYTSADIDRIRDEVMPTVIEHGRWHGELTMLHKSGRTGHIETVVVPVRDDDGEVVGAISINRDISQRVAALKRLEYLAFHDPITGIANRMLAFERIDRAISRAKRSNKRMAIAFIDLDGFKRVNDAFGHAAGDDVLREVASRLKASVRAVDTAARIGGDEFLLILEVVDGLSEVDEIVARCAEHMLVPHEVGGQQRTVGASIGVALFPDDATERDGLLRHADDEMYRAKRGRYGRRS